MSARRVGLVLEVATDLAFFEVVQFLLMYKLIRNLTNSANFIMVPLRLLRKCEDFSLTFLFSDNKKGFLLNEL